MGKILVVDDEQDICEILQFNLETEGYEVDVAYSAEEAMRLPLAEYDLLLLDVMMGEMSGFQFARFLKQEPKTSDLPIIFITALDDENNVVKGLNIGADDYMSKPLSMREVKARVQAHAPPAVGIFARTSSLPYKKLNERRVVSDDDVYSMYSRSLRQSRLPSDLYVGFFLFSFLASITRQPFF